MIKLGYEVKTGKEVGIDEESDSFSGGTSKE